MKIQVIVYVLLLLVSCQSEPAALPKKEQNNQQPEYVPVSLRLYNEIRSCDSVMFAAFNEHDTEKLMRFFANDLEFYHDKGGLADHAETRKGFENLFAANKSTGLRRDIVPGTLEVYPINDFGAVETCQHHFCHKENGKDDCGTFKNTMIWKKTNEGWKVTRVISYDH